MTRTQGKGTASGRPLSALGSLSGPTPGGAGTQEMDIECQLIGMDCESGVDSLAENGSYTPINTRITRDNSLANLQKIWNYPVGMLTSGSFDWL
jgi:hypothetical protein